MALKVNFVKNNIGVPMPDCYIKVDSVFFDSVNKVIRTNVIFYVNQAQRLNDIRDKRKVIETQLEAKKAEIMVEQSKTPSNPDTLQTLYGELASIQNQLEMVTGDSPFYSKIFEFPVTGSEDQNYVTLTYLNLKVVNFAGRDDGKAIELDFTQAVDI